MEDGVMGTKGRLEFNGNYEILKVVRDDINEGWVWIRDVTTEGSADSDTGIDRRHERPSDPPKEGAALEAALSGRRRILRLRYKGRPVYCEGLYAGDGDIRRFQERFRITYSNSIAPQG
jgi:hypothetical protein